MQYILASWRLFCLALWLEFMQTWFQLVCACQWQINTIACKYISCHATFM